jgi:hypothetical protein
MVLDPFTTFHLIHTAYQHGKVGFEIGKRLAIHKNNRGIVDYVSETDYGNHVFPLLCAYSDMCPLVWFDFSDWSEKSLNSSTTSFVFGIPDGTLKVKVGGETYALECKTSGKTIPLFCIKQKQCPIAKME